MGLYYVNDHLFTEEVLSESHWPQNNDEPYKRIMLRTTPQAVLKQEDGTLVPATKAVCIHNCSLLQGNVKTRIASTLDPEGLSRFPRITVRTSTDTRYDTDVFVVAIPYNGMIRPFAHDEDMLSIYKSIILKSDQASIEHMDMKYRRCAYFVVAPNYKNLGNDGWYGVESNLVMTTAQSDLKARGITEETAKWTFKTTTVRFGENGLYEITCTEETAPYSAFNPEDIKGKEICSHVEPTVMKTGGKNAPAPSAPKAKAPAQQPQQGNPSGGKKKHKKKK